MAITKIKAIKSTLDKAIHYITNPEKTDGGLLVDSYKCVPEFADQQMHATAQKNKRGCRQAYHLMQSFSPEDNITPEQALEIGKIFANKVTRGKHEYVIAVHNDKDHIHCHIIFNSVDFKDYGKYRYKGYSERDRIRDISDKLCRDNGLSVLPRWTKGKGKGRYEYEKYKQGKSWMEKLRLTIDKAILASDTFEDFLAAMEMEGYTLNTSRRKHIAFTAEEEGQIRSTRCKTIGQFYTEDVIRDRIANKEKYKDVDVYPEGKKAADEKRGGREPAGTETVQNTEQSKNTRKWKPDSRRINLIADLSQNVKAQNSGGYKHVVEKSNLNALVKTMNFLMKNNIETPEHFEEFYDAAYQDVISLNRSIQKIELEIAGLCEKRDYIRTYFANKKFYNTFVKYRNMDYYREHESEIRDFELAKAWLEHNAVDLQSYTYERFQEEYHKLCSSKDVLYEKLKTSKTLLSDTSNVMKNVETALGIKLYEKKKTGSGSNQKRDSKEDDLQQKNEKER